MASWIRRVILMGFLSANFQLSTPFHSRIRSKHGTDRRTDDGHQRLMPPSYGGHNNGSKRLKSAQHWFAACLVYRWEMHRKWMIYENPWAKVFEGRRLWMIKCVSWTIFCLLFKKYVVVGRNLAVNPWHCGCELRQVVEWLSTRAVELRDSNSTLCRTPSDLSGSFLSQLLSHTSPCCK